MADWRAPTSVFTLFLLLLSPSSEAAAGPEVVRMPDVIGAEVALAEAQLARHGIAVRVMGPEEGIGRRVVVGQSPGAGEPVTVGAQARITYRFYEDGARRPGDTSTHVTVPDVRGLEAERAVDLLAQRGLRATLRGVEEGEGRRVVRAQNPAAGASVPRGSAVRVATEWVEPGAISPATGAVVVVPDVRGQALDLALPRLALLGLVGVPRGTEEGEGVATVSAQNPPPGTETRRGAEVRLSYEWVGVGEVPTAGPRESAVPDVRGVEAGLAVRRLQADGFTARLSGPEEGDGRRLVIAQNPAPGDVRRRGTEIRLSYRWSVLGDPPPGVPGAARRVAVPRVIGLTPQQAQVRLEQAGFGSRLLGPQGGEEGVAFVVGQHPAAGTVTTRGYVVRLTWRYSR